MGEVEPRGYEWDRVERRDPRYEGRNGLSGAMAEFPVLTGFGAGYPDGGEPLCFGRDELLLVRGTVADTELKVEPNQEHKHG